MSESVLSPYIVSDCHAIGDMAPVCNCSSGHSTYIHPGHGYAKDGPDAVNKALTGGTDINCGCYYEKYLLSSLNDTKVAPKSVDLAAGRVMNALLQTGQLDSTGKNSSYTRIPLSEVDSPGARQLAREAAQQSIVLLRNDPVGSSALLPLSSSLKSLAMIGPHANATQALLSNYHGD